MTDRPSPAKVLVLIVEDEPIVRMCAVDIVQDSGFEVLEAESGDEAVRILESLPNIRIVFTDIDLPGSMNGLKLAAAIRERWPSIDIILTSGYRAVAAGNLKGRSVFIPKPYALERVVEALRDLTA